MTALLIVALSLGMSPGVIQFQGVPGSQGTLLVLTPRTYSVWIWAPCETGASVTVGDQPFTVAPNAKEKAAYKWMQAGTVTVREDQVPVVKPPTGGTAEVITGKLPVALDSHAVGVMLIADPDVDANKIHAVQHVYDDPRAVRDSRRDTIRDTNTVFTMPEYKTREEWEAFASKLRRRVLLSSGLLPMPEKTPLNAVVSGRVDRDDYSVEKVQFEARPGFLVTGNLYRPKGQGPFPAIVSPHGHWEKGRLENVELGSVPGRCITLARMGAVVFTYDMIGYVDSLQYKHSWGGEREKLWGYHPFAAQLWSSVRAVDFLQSLPDVDPERIACTGASGGGTQTFALYAIDPRVQVSAPVNMISSTMQGGCICENAPILRLDASNMQIGALMAPRPMMMVSATGDWTRETPRVEYPALRSIWELYGAQDQLDTVIIDAPHNYNKQSREAVYRFFGTHFFNKPEYANFTEPDFQVEPDEALRVFPDKKLPEGLPTADEITEQVIESTRAKWDAAMPKDAAGLETFRTDYGDVLSLVTGATVPDVNDLVGERTGYYERDGYIVERWVISRRTVGDAVPAILYRGPNTVGAQHGVVLVYSAGKEVAANVENGEPTSFVRQLLDQGQAVLAIDVFGSGDHHSVLSPSEAAAGKFPDTFRPTITGHRIQDIITAGAWLRARRDINDNVDVIGCNTDGVSALFAAAIDPAISRVFAQGGFDPNRDDAWAAYCYIPCIRSVGDLATAGALIAPRPVVLFNAEPEFVQRVQKGYAAGGTNVQQLQMDVDMLNLLK